MVCHTLTLGLTTGQTADVVRHIEQYKDTHELQGTGYVYEI